jgi:gliding motility-associated-like protein
LLNDFFKPYLGEILPSKYLLQIYNRWGEIVFETSDPDKGWDGTRNGRPVQRGIFVYKVTFEVPEFITNSLESPFSGTFMLIR